MNRATLLLFLLACAPDLDVVWACECVTEYALQLDELDEWEVCASEGEADAITTEYTDDCFDAAQGNVDRGSVSCTCRCETAAERCP